MEIQFTLFGKDEPEPEPFEADLEEFTQEIQSENEEEEEEKPQDKIALVSYAYAFQSEFDPKAFVAAFEKLPSYDCQYEKDMKEHGFVHYPQEFPEKHEDVVHDAYKVAKKATEDLQFPVCLAGDSSLLYGFVKGLHTEYDDLGVVKLGARCDVHDNEEEPYAPQCAMRRVHEITPHMSFVGTKIIDEAEKDFIEKHKLWCLFSHNIHDYDKWMEPFVKGLQKHVCLAVSFDCLDHGGLDWHQVMKLMELMVKEKTVVGIYFYDVKDTEACAQFLQKLLVLVHR